MNQTVNNIQLTWKLTWLLRKYRTCNLTVRFSKYIFYNKLLDGVTFLKVTPCITWTQSYIYIYIWEMLMNSFKEIFYGKRKKN